MIAFVVLIIIAILVCCIMQLKIKTKQRSELFTENASLLSEPTNLNSQNSQNSQNSPNPSNIKPKRDKPNGKKSKVRFSPTVQRRYIDIESPTGTTTKEGLLEDTTEGIKSAYRVVPQLPKSPKPISVSE